MEVRIRWRDQGIGRRLLDITFVLACLVLTALAAKAHWSPLPRPVIVVAGVAGTLAQCWRRTRPTLAAVAGAVAYPLSGNYGPVLLGLHAGASHAPRRRLWVAAAAGGASYAAWSWIDGGRLSVADAGAAVGIAVVVTAWGLFSATRRDLAELATAEHQLREDRARIAERTRIAREMHDVLAHKVSLIAVHAGALELAASGQGERLEQGAALIRVTAREALQELRYVLGVLRDESAARPLGSAEDSGTREDSGEPFADLSALVAVAQRLGQRIELHDDAGPLPTAMARVVYRVVQEGLTNARKHAPDAPVAIHVERGAAGTVTVTVENTAPSGPPLGLPGSGAGLIGLAERLRLVGGTFASGPLGADRGGGWRLRAVLPRFDHYVDSGSTTSGKATRGQ